MGLLIGLTTFTDLPFEVVIAVVIAVGVVAPGLFPRDTDDGTEQMRSLHRTSFCLIGHAIYTNWEMIDGP